MAPVSLAIPRSLQGTSTTSVDTPPPPPATLEELTKPLTAIPICDRSAPACKEELKSAYEEAYSSLNSILDRNVHSVIMRVDKITGSASDGYESNGVVVWDPVAENNRGAVGSGLAMGIVSLLGGSSPLEAVGSAADATASGYDSKTQGKCLLSADQSFKGFGEVQLFLNTPNLTSLKGYEEGSYVKVTFVGSFLPFRNSGMFDQNSWISREPGESNFGTVTLYSVGATVTPAIKPKLHLYCTKTAAK
jgi:hypothetical protein